MIPRVLLGRTTVEVARLGLGTAPLGDHFAHVADDDAHAILTAAVDLVDTAPWYGLGLSEHRVGRFVRSVARDRVVVATKVGRVLRPAPPGRSGSSGWIGGLNFDAQFDYGYAGVMRSHEDSLQRLGLDRVDLLAIHDLDSKHFGEDELETRIRELARGGVRALQELRGSGTVAGIGLGINTIGAIPRVLELIDLDYVILAMPYTLLDQAALDEELPLCLARGVSVVIGAVFASGILASDTGTGTYGYEQAPSAIVQQVARLRTVCRRHGVSLGTVALQFPLAHPAVAAVIPGAVTADEVRENVARLTSPVPPALWEELKAERLLREDAPVSARERDFA